MLRLYLTGLPPSLPWDKQRGAQGSHCAGPRCGDTATSVPELRFTEQRELWTFIQGMLQITYHIGNMNGDQLMIMPDLVSPLLVIKLKLTFIEMSINLENTLR